MQDHQPQNIEVSGYYPGVVGKITELHAVYCHEHWDFDCTFETQVGRELSEFIRDFQKGRDGFWAALIHGEFAGSIGIDGQPVDEKGVRLRWFIVAPELQGRGAGKTLMSYAVEFCRKVGHQRIHLWTFQGLDAARGVYEKAGFRLVKEHDIYQWGDNIREQMFELVL